MKNKNLIKSVIIIFVLIIVVSFIEFIKPKDETILNFSPEILVEDQSLVTKLFNENNLIVYKKDLTYSLKLSKYFTGKRTAFIGSNHVLIVNIHPLFKGVPIRSSDSYNECFFDLDTLKLIDSDECLYFLNSLKDSFNFLGEIIPTVVDKQALAIGKEFIQKNDIAHIFIDPAGEQLEDFDVDLMIAPISISKDNIVTYTLVWRVAPSSVEIGNTPEVFIDAKTGDILEDHAQDL